MLKWMPTWHEGRLLKPMGTRYPAKKPLNLRHVHQGCWAVGEKTAHWHGSPHLGRDTKMSSSHSHVIPIYSNGGMGSYWNNVFFVLSKMTSYISFSFVLACLKGFVFKQELEQALTERSTVSNKIAEPNDNHSMWLDMPWIRTFYRCETKG